MILGSVNITQRAVSTHRDSYLLENLSVVSVHRPFLASAVIIGGGLAGLRQNAGKVDKQIDQLLNRIVEADNQSVIKAYENKITTLEKEKLLIAEKLQNQSKPRHAFEKMFELALEFLSPPWNLWASGQIHLRKIVLRLAFAERIAYTRNERFSNPKKSLPFKMLEGMSLGKCEMARLEGFEPPTA